MAYAALGGNGYGEGGGRYPGVGMAAPQQAAVAPAPAAAPAGPDPNLWYDPSKLQAAIQAQGAGQDGRTILNGQYLDSIINPNYNPTSKFLPGEAAHMGFSGSAADDNWTMLDARPDQLDVGGQVINLTKGDDGKYTYFNNFDNPSANNGSKNQAQIQFSYDPATGKSTPIGSGSYDQYNPSFWIRDGRLIAELAAVVGSAGVAGAASAGAFGGAGAGAGAAEGGAAAAGGGAGGGATNAALIESATNGAGYGASSAGSGLGAYSSGAGYAGLGSAAVNTNATNPALIESASNTAGYGASSAGAGGGAGAAAGSGIGSYLKNGYDAYKAYAGAQQGQGGQGGGMAALFGLGGMTAGDRYRQQLAQQALSQQAYSQQNQQQAMPGWIGGS